MPSDIANSTIVVKLGGSVLGETSLLHQFAGDVVELVDRGARVVVTHGGGQNINARLLAAGIEPTFIGGLRYTDEATMAVVRATLTGEVQRHITDAINALGPLSVGLSGEDARMFVAHKRTRHIDGTPVDLGLVGDIVQVDTTVVEAILQCRLTPVITCLASGTAGEVFNLNADTAASALAVALKADQLLLLTDVASLYGDWPVNEQPIHELTTLQARALMTDIEGGMAPKLQACIDAIAGGVVLARMVDGRGANALGSAIRGTNEGTSIRHG